MCSGGSEVNSLEFGCGGLKFCGRVRGCFCEIELWRRDLGCRSLVLYQIERL